MALKLAVAMAVGRLIARGDSNIVVLAHQSTPPPHLSIFILDACKDSQPANACKEDVFY